MNSELLAKALGIPLARAEKWAPHINEALQYAALNTPDERARFLAQIAHESGGLVYSREIWGPTPTQTRYEGRTDLGNISAGDGRRYLGRGPLQVTGRANYRRMCAALRKSFPDCPDFEEKPETLEQPRWGALAAAQFWNVNGLKHVADFTTLTRRINGGENGLKDRRDRYEKILPLLKTLT